MPPRKGESRKSPDTARRRAATNDPSRSRRKADRSARKRDRELYGHDPQWSVQILQQLPTAIVGIDNQHRISFWNARAEALFGYRADEILGQSATLLAVDHQTAGPSDDLWTLLKRDGQLRITQPLRHKSGASRPAQFDYALLRDAKGQPCGAVLAVVEIAPTTASEWLRPGQVFEDAFDNPGEGEIADSDVPTFSDVIERRALEQQIVDLTVREQRRIGQDLHDGVGQELTGLGYLAKNLHRKLMLLNLPEAGTAAAILRTVRKTLRQVRYLAKGLNPVEVEANGLMAALDDLAMSTEQLFGISCRFQCEQPVLLENNNTATQLFRIAQEATTNAAKHSGAQHIVLSLEQAGQRVVLRIR